MKDFSSKLFKIYVKVILKKERKKWQIGHERYGKLSIN